MTVTQINVNAADNTLEKRLTIIKKIQNSIKTTLTASGIVLIQQLILY